MADVSEPKKGMIDQLTTVRAIFALMVFFYHSGSFFFLSSTARHIAFARNGNLGVDAFFVLSGFILMHVYGAKIVPFRWSTAGEFLWARLARIYPMHLLTIFVFIVYFAVFSFVGMRSSDPDRYSAISLVANFFLVHAWFGLNGSWNAPSWSISAEWAAYLTFPILAGALERIRPYTALILAIVLFWLIQIFLPFNDANLYLEHGVRNLKRIGLEFFLGMALYRIVFPNASLADTLAGLALLIAGVLASFGQGVPAVLALGFGLVFLRDGRGPLQRLFSHRVGVYAGEISYSFYMLHFFVLSLLQNGMRIAAPRFLRSEAATDIVTLVGLAATIAGAMFCYRFVELPARDYLRKLVIRRQKVV